MFDRPSRSTRSRTAWLITAISVLICLAALGAPAASAAEATVDDAVTSGPNFFTYTGTSWTTCGGCNSTATNGSYRYAYTTGNTAVSEANSIRCDLAILVGLRPRRCWCRW